MYYTTVQAVWPPCRNKHLLLLMSQGLLTISMASSMSSTVNWLFQVQKGSQPPAIMTLVLPTATVWAIAISRGAPGIYMQPHNRQLHNRQHQLLSSSSSDC
jgi:hypothetical protein